MHLFYVALIGWPSPSGAQTPQAPTIQVIPESVVLGLNGRGTVTVFLRNDTRHALRNVALSAQSGDGLTADTSGLRLAQLAPLAVHTWTLPVTRPNGAPLTGQLYLRADFEWQRSDGGPLVHATSILNLPVRTATAETAESWATVQLLTTLSSLQEHRPGTIYLVLTNKTADSLRVVRVTSHGPSFVSSVVHDMAAAAAPLAAGQTRTITVDVKAGTAVQSGKHLLLFEIELAREQPGSTRRATLVASHELDVGVFGESQLLTLLGVPSFLVLPGFLIVATIGLLWTYTGIPNAAGVVPAYAFKTLGTDFWLVAVTLSLLSAVVYPTLTGRNYLDGYGMIDVALVWGGSVLFAVVGFTVVTGTWRFVRWRRRWKEGRLLPALTDDQLTTLEKLARRRLSLNLKQADVTIAGKQERGFLLEPDFGVANDLWVAPGITLKTDPKTAPDILDQLQALLDAGDAAALAEFLRINNREKKQFVVGWKPRGALEHPTPVPRKDVASVGGPALSIIEA